MRLISTLLTLIAMSAAMAADIGVSPARLSVTLPRGGSATEVVTLTTTAPTNVPLDVSKADWTLSPAGAISFLPAGGTLYSATSWISPESGQVVVPHSGTTSFRFTVTVPPGGDVAGTYHTVLFFTTQAAVAPGTGAKIASRQRLGLVIYVTIAGTEQNGSTLSDFYRDGKNLTLVIDNTGNTLMRTSGKIEFRDSNGKTVASVDAPDRVVLRGTTIDAAVAIPSALTPGYYVALALIEDSRGGLLAGQLPIEVK